MSFEFLKVNSILSQYGIEEANLIDLYIEDYFKKFNKKNIKLVSNFFINTQKVYLFVPVYILVFRNDVETKIKIFTFDKKNLIKIFLEKDLLFTKFNIFLLNILGKKEDFYFIFFFNLLKYKGFFFSFKNRKFLKARKINFRRKIKKNLYNE